MKKLLLLTVLLMAMGTVVSAEPLRMTLDYYPPFEYEESGEAKGIGTQVVRAVLKEAGMEAVYKQYPFSRAYKMVTEGKEPVFYYSLVRTPERENLVRWVGIVAPSEQVIVARKDTELRVEQLADLKNQKIGTVTDDVVDQYLMKYQDKLNLKMDKVTDYEQNVKKLMKKRFDFLGMDRFVFFYLLEKLGYSKDEVKIVFVIEDLKSNFYLAANKSVPEDTVKNLQSAFTVVHNNGTYQTIVDGYFGKAEAPGQ